MDSFLTYLLEEASQLSGEFFSHGDIHMNYDFMRDMWETYITDSWEYQGAVEELQEAKDSLKYGVVFDFMDDHNFELSHSDWDMEKDLDYAVQEQWEFLFEYELDEALSTGLNVLHRYI